MTQNVDGFHVEAGSRNVIEIHGNMRSIKCTQCDFSLQIAGLDYDELKVTSLPPLCSECESVLRPDVVLFEEMLPESAVSEMMKQA